MTIQLFLLIFRALRHPNDETSTPKPHTLSPNPQMSPDKFSSKAPYPVPGTFPSPYALPAGFLSGPAPNLQKNDIDFKKTELPEYDGLYATVLDGVFTKEECQTLVKAAEARTNGEWEQALINVGNGEQMLITDARDCGRIIWDDREMVAKIWGRVKDHIPEITSLYDMPKVTGNGPARWKETWQISRLNERMRFLKYGKGQYFRRES